MLSLAMHDAMRAICQGRGQGATRSGILMMNNGLILTGGTPALPNSIGADPVWNLAGVFRVICSLVNTAPPSTPFIFGAGCLASAVGTRHVTSPQTDDTHPATSCFGGSAPMTLRCSPHTWKSAFGRLGTFSTTPATTSSASTFLADQAWCPIW